MDFCKVNSRDAAGSLLAHSIRFDKSNFKKGRKLSEEDVTALLAAGIEEVTVARMARGDLHEDEAAAMVAAAIRGANLNQTAAFTGRCNLIAQARGLAVIDRGRLDAFNLTDECITIATVPPYGLVEPRQMVATVKMIPFAANGKIIDQAMQTLGNEPLISVAPLRARQIGLVQTELSGMKVSLLDKTFAALNQRLAHLDCPPAEERRCAHDPSEISSALKELQAEGCELLLVSGASAIVDRRDVVPQGIAQAGGAVLHFGMPVDPGNLLLLSEWDGLPVLGLPGCARSPKVNGFDWVLERLLCDLPVGSRDIMQMGAGGLLMEIAQRPLPRSFAVEGTPDPEHEGRPLAPRAPKIAALLLAAGQSRRMGHANKLLADVNGKPLVRHAVEALKAAQISDLVVVTGHQAQEVTSALADMELVFAHNPDYASGLASSLKRGLASLPGQPDGVIIMLGDMPRISTAVINSIIAGFNPVEGRSICLPTWQGKRGNPVLISRQFFAELQTLHGDVGARHLLSDYPELVAEIAIDDRSILDDIDTPEALAALRTDS
jgi:molybdenum cofactor cytidylyltransferase